MYNVDDEKYFLNGGVKSIIFLPLLIWFITSLSNLITTHNSFLTLFFNPVNVVFGILFFIFIIYHLHVEVLYLIDVYVKAKKYNKNLKGIVVTVTYVVIFFVFLSVLKIHFNSILVL